MNLLCPSSLTIIKIVGLASPLSIIRLTPRLRDIHALAVPPLSVVQHLARKQLCVPLYHLSSTSLLLPIVVLVSMLLTDPPEGNYVLNVVLGCIRMWS